MCKGNRGILDAKDKKKANHNQYCSSKLKVQADNKYSVFKLPVIV